MAAPESERGMTQRYYIELLKSLTIAAYFLVEATLRRIERNPRLDKEDIDTLSVEIGTAKLQLHRLDRCLAEYQVKVNEQSQMCFGDDDSHIGDPET